MQKRWEIYIFPGLAAHSAAGKYVNRSWEYINRSQTHECGNWDWGRAIPRKGINKWDFPCCVCWLCCAIKHTGDPEIRGIRCLAANKLTHTLEKTLPTYGYHLWICISWLIWPTYFWCEKSVPLALRFVSFFALQNPHFFCFQKLFSLLLSPMCWPATVAHFSMISCMQILHIFSCQSFSTRIK
jgi:hypothetical protein